MSGNESGFHRTLAVVSLNVEQSENRCRVYCAQRSIKLSEVASFIEGHGSRADRREEPLPLPTQINQNHQKFLQAPKL